MHEFSDYIGFFFYNHWYIVCFVVFGMVPFIKACLGTTLPMLGMAKHDNMKWVFASGMTPFTVTGHKL